MPETALHLDAREPSGSAIKPVCRASRWPGSSRRHSWQAFRPDLWPAEVEETADGVYLRLKDGTRLVGEEFSWRKNRNVANDRV
jgi:hypothetical protein